MKLSLSLSAVAAATVTLATPSLAADFKCNKAQSFCTIDSKQLTIGDRVGFFNNDEEIVAYGAVEKVEDQTRYVKIEQANGRLKASDTYALLDDNKAQNIGTNYKMYRESAKAAVGGDVGLASVGLGEGAVGFGASVYGNWKWQRDIYFAGRGFLLSTSGKAVNETTTVESSNFQATMFGLMPTVQWITAQHKPFSARAEAGIGFAHATASISNNGEVKDYLNHIEPGFGLAMRGAVGVQANFKEWHPTLDAAVNRVQNSNYQMISVGILRDLK